MLHWDKAKVNPEDIPAEKGGARSQSTNRRQRRTKFTGRFWNENGRLITSRPFLFAELFYESAAALSNESSRRMF